MIRKSTFALAAHAAIAAIAFSHNTASATEGGVSIDPPGVESTVSSALPPPGVYGMTYFRDYQASKARDNNGNVVISGDKAAVDLAIEKAKELGARAIPLNVSAPFHCPLMQPAADEMAQALASATILAPRAPLVANVTARPTLDPEEIRRLLVEQVTGRVRWRESMIWLAGEGGVTRFAEAGAGKVLSGMAKRIAPDAEATPLNTPADLEAFAKGL